MVLDLYLMAATVVRLGVGVVRLRIVGEGANGRGNSPDMVLVGLKMDNSLPLSWMSSLLPLLLSAAVPADSSQGTHPVYNDKREVPTLSFMPRR